MEIVTNIINTTLESFDFSYCITVNILTYIIITLIGGKIKKVTTSVWAKRGILLASIVIIGVVYYAIDIDIKLILNSAIITPVFWSWIMKPICKYFKLDYKQINVFE